MDTSEQRFTVESEAGTLVRVRWSPAIVLRASDGRSLTTGLDLALAGRRAHLLMFLNGMASLSQDALTYFAKRASLSAVALVGPSVLDPALIDLYLEVYEPPFPVAYFDAETAARSWLAQQPSLGPPPAPPSPLAPPSEAHD